MRTIKFRGKDIETEKFVFGDLVSIQTRRGIGFGIKDTIYHVNDGCINIIPDEVAPETIGQFTGLTDKNGTEVYEGDILESSTNEFDVHAGTWEVVFDEGQFCGKNSSQGIVHLAYWSGLSLEVIGNIHQTPEPK